MRPINKGFPSQIYSSYGLAQPDLISRIGRFCSYCERKVPVGIAVEHKRPKNKYPGEELLWSNFLLSCSNCNSTKLAKKISLSTYLWPDLDNTFRAFKYTEEGVIRARKSIPRKVRRKANRTIYLLGLDKFPGSFREPTDRDYRWLDRRQAWDKAVAAREQLRDYDTPCQRQRILTFAQDSIFSIWMEVFKNDIDMRRSLISVFPGTATECFDFSCKPITRPGGCI